MSPKQHTRTALQRVLRLAALALFCVATPVWVRAQGTTAYVYDDNGRLHAVVSPTGEAAVYEYDAAGNFTAIRRLTADDLELLSFSPREGVPGDLVTFVGVGFGAGVNALLFNGTPARVVSVSVPQVVAEVPQGATSGPVTLVTPRGSVTTPVPFTIRGLHVSPAAAKLISGESLLFTATVVLGGDQSVRWSVNGAEGGDAGVGTISLDGLYTAPSLPQNLPSSLVFVRATSVAAPEVFGEAQVTVLGTEFVLPARAAGVSVRIADARDSSSSLVGRGVTVRIASPAESSAPASGGVSVKIASASETSTPAGAAVSVRIASEPDVSAPSSAGVSARIADAADLTPTFAAGVSTTTAPNISSIAPGQISRGTTINVTIGGANFGGATGIKFIAADGSVDTNVVASNLTVSADGTSLTATLSVGAGATLGQYVLVVTTSGGHSLTADGGGNRIVIQ